MYLFLHVLTSHLQSTLHLMQYTYQDIFSTAQSSFGACQFQCLLVLLPFFCFTSSISIKHFPLRTFFIQENKNKSCSRWIGRVGRFGVKTAGHSCGVGRCARKSPIMKWANALKESSKKIDGSRRQPLTTTPVGALIEMGSRTLT